MRLWSLHPKYLDSVGLVALWREALLAQKVLEGKTKGYRNHPQLIRFKNTRDPLLYIGTYLYHIHLEAKRRRYKFDASKIKKFSSEIERIPVKRGQVEYEFAHLLRKLEKRNRERYEELKEHSEIEVNPVFCVIEGGIEDWEVLISRRKD
uniref:DNA lyase n=1 Tax=Archaeoglobus fulgidus TaxID=2234 RepID=A0A7C3RCC4_ARCFL